MTYDAVSPLPENPDRITRVVLATAGLSVTGGLVGALCAFSAVSVVAINAGGVDAISEAGPLLLVAAAFGAVCGMVGAPILGWCLLRRVTLGRTILYTAAGTMLGAVGGELLRLFNPLGPGVPGIMVGAFTGFVGSAVCLALHEKLTRARSIDPVA